ncbi:hypothetical protein TorRG33x02_347590, partial [Trema orientale]
SQRNVSKPLKFVFWKHFLRHCRVAPLPPHIFSFPQFQFRSTGIITRPNQTNIISIPRRSFIQRKAINIHQTLPFLLRNSITFRFEFFPYSATGFCNLTTLKFINPIPINISWRFRLKLYLGFKGFRSMSPRSRNHTTRRLFIPIKISWGFRLKLNLGFKGFRSTSPRSRNHTTRRVFIPINICWGFRLRLNLGFKGFRSMSPRSRNHTALSTKTL